MNFLFLTLQIILLLLFSFPVKTIAQSDNSIIVQNNSTNEAKLAEAEKLNEQVIELYEQEKYTQAVALAQKVLAIRQEILGEKHLDTAQSLHNLGFLYNVQGKYQQAETVYLRALAIRKEILGEKNIDTADSFRNLALLYLSQKNYQKAEPLLLQALTIRKKILGENDSDTAISFAELKELYQEQGKYTKAIPFAQKVLAIYQEILGEKHLGTVKSLNALAHLYSLQGKYQEAEPFLIKALAIYREVSGEKHKYTAIALNNLAELYRLQGKYQEAESLFLEALAIRKEILGEKHPDIADSLNSLATIHHSLGKYQEVESLVLQALAIRKETLGEKHPDTVLLFSNLAVLYRTQGKYKEAEPLFLQALAVYKEILGDKHPNTADSIDDLALLYNLQGNYQEAESLFLQALAIRKEILGLNHPDTAQSILNLGLLYSNQGKYEQAESFYLQALTSYKEILGEKHPDISTPLNNLAELYRKQEKYQQAESLQLQAIAIKKEILGENHSNLAINFNNLALVYKAQGKYEQAKPLYLQALETRKEVLGENHPYTGFSLLNLSGFYWATDNISLALDYLTQGGEVQEYNLAEFLNNIGDESRKQAYLKSISATLDWTISLHLNDVPNNIQASRLALTTILRRKGRVLDALSNIVSNLRQQQNPAIQKVFDDLGAKRSQLASLTYQGIGNRTPETYQKLITTLEQDISKLETDLSNKSREFRTINQPITLDAVQKAIPSNTALIEYMVYEPFNPKTSQWDKPRYAAYILHPNGEPEGIDLGDAETIDKLIEEFRFYIGSEDYQYYETELLESSQQLYQLVFKPLLPLLKNTKTLLISPDSQLNLIPFVALQDEQEKYLLEDYSITYLTSGRDLLKLQTKFESQSESVIIANPTYSLDRSEIVGAKRRGSRRAADLDTLLNCCEPLKHTKVEAEAITPLLADAQVYTEEKAIVENFANIKAPKILHIATHGFFLPDLEKEEISDDFELNNQFPKIRSENPLLRAGLAFTGFNPANNQMEGALTALDASSLYLWGTKLLVLSACETGLGDVKVGEGVYGLRRAFVLAGVESQVMSLWSVFDKTTQELMVRYYQRLMDGEGRSQSLRQVQLEMLNSEEYQHPVHWAPFIANGDWRSLD